MEQQQQTQCILFPQRGACDILFRYYILYHWKQKKIRSLKVQHVISHPALLILISKTNFYCLSTVKRDVKVKALEAAEAAKRLEEKKENERKMRKEAMKHERARLEQENSKQLELHKKRKEEEKKKKEADAIARKRLREVEEKNERERKRKRVEEARRQQREQDDKTHAKRAEKDKGLPTNVCNIRLTQYSPFSASVLLFWY